MKTPALIATIAGSPSASSISTRILDYAAAKLVGAGFRTKAIRLRELPAGAVIAGDRKSPPVASALQGLHSADVVWVATPIYKGAYSGMLKTFLDLLPADAFRDKIVIPIASAGSLAHAPALDYMLRPVLQSLGSVDVLPGIYFVEGQASWSAETGLRLDEQLAGQLHGVINHIAAVVPAWKPRPAADQPATAPASDPVPETAWQA